ncbi:MAG TPA: DUF456 domain-containing protein [Nocardioides sp.]|uniref:DUF456 domain-containing protein n=1 Tax=Nocardioides sp. TaxID=35761 RepID=UPI002C3956D3|nr:DUF456 domain-containing protein [Nocardioides sp.]HQR26761.1 DUF456 domain-containing protein [Nocardioides sp.]
MTLVEVAVGLAILVGLVGIVVPVLPGTILIAGALLVWATESGDPTAWLVTGLALAVLAVGAVVKYALPGKQLKAAVPTETLLVGSLAALAGFFVIPVVGALVGFPIGVYVAERVRVGRTAAWPSTKAALRAMGVSLLIEFVAGLLATAAWLVGVTVV